MNGKTCGEECKKGCGEGSDACCSINSCNGCGCGCGHKTVRIIVKIALVVIIFWVGVQFGKSKAMYGYQKYGPMMQGGMMERQY